MKEGDIVAFTMRDGRYRAGIMVRWSVDWDSNPLIMDLEGETYRPFATDCHPPPAQVEGRCVLTVETAEMIEKPLIARMLSKEGQERIAGQSSQVTAIIRKGIRTPVIRDTVLPEGEGSPEESTDVPMNLVQGFTGRLNRRMVYYLMYSHDPYERTLAQLAERHPGYFQVYMSHAVDEEKLTDIARELDVSYETVRNRHRRAKKFIEAKMKAYEDAA